MEEEENNFIAFMISKPTKESSFIITKTTRFTSNEDDYYDELLETYNKFFIEHIKSKNTRKKALESG